MYTVTYWNTEDHRFRSKTVDSKLVADEMFTRLCLQNKWAFFQTPTYGSVCNDPRDRVPTSHMYTKCSDLANVYLGGGVIAQIYHNVFTGDYRVSIGGDTIVDFSFGEMGVFA